MKKKLLITAIAITALASCSSNDFVGDQEVLNSSGNGAISFISGTPSVTRSGGETAAGLLNNNFVLFGYKGTDSKVFDNYQVNYVVSTAGSTESNSAGWEYVGYKNLPGGVGTNVGVTAFSATTTGDPNNSAAIDQSIKYWDFSAGTYDFFAYSLGIGTGGGSPTYARASAMSASTYTLTGSQAELGACYISKKKHMESLSSATTQVQLEFVNFLSKIQLKFFETIPGYSVKDLKFYVASDTKSTGNVANDGLAPAIYTASTLPTGGTYTITFDDAYAPVVTLSSSSSTDTKITFPAVSTSPSNVWLDNYAGKDYNETDAPVYLGRTSSTATASKQIPVLPNSTGAVLTLKMDYTLLSRDGSGETIEITGANATIPADYTKWKPNYAYTYIFKISDNTNGETLYPITLDAIVTETEDGSQTTITTVATPSITTYAKEDRVVTATEDITEYLAGDIYVVVNNGETLTPQTNAKLYTATIETGAAQSITEETVANALTKVADGSGNYILTDALGKKLTVTPVASDAADKLIVCSEIPAADAPGGKAVSITGAKFQAIHKAVVDAKLTDGKTYYTSATGYETHTASGSEELASGKYEMESRYYVFEYIYTESAVEKKAYKVIRIK